MMVEVSIDGHLWDRFGKCSERNIPMMCAIRQYDPFQRIP